MTCFLAHPPEITYRSGVQLAVRVGKADWTVIASPDVVDALQSEDGPAGHPDEISSPSLERLMASFRHKAVLERCYGGGTITIDAGDLIAPADPEDHGPPAALKAWYTLLTIGSAPSWQAKPVAAAQTQAPLRRNECAGV